MSYFGQFCDAPAFNNDDGNPDDQRLWYRLGTLLGTTNHQFFTPFLNATTYRLMSWFYSLSTSKSLSDLIVPSMMLSCLMASVEMTYKTLVLLMMQFNELTQAWNQFISQLRMVGMKPHLKYLFLVRKSNSRLKRI